MKAWRITSRVCSVVVLTSVLACVCLAVVRSQGLVAVTVTATDPAAEPLDHNIPLVKQREALPDYELALVGDLGEARYLGIKPDQSAAAGLTWQLDDPVSVMEIAAVRLREKDKLISDAIAEVHISGPSVESNGYRFDFKIERSLSVGVHAFFATPIGLAIVTGLGVAVFLIVLARFLG